jgi:hypothetical protein
MEERAVADDKPALSWFRPSDAAPRADERSPLRHPARMLAAVGAAIVAVGVLLPWVEYRIDTEAGQANGFTGDTWGIFMLAAVGGLVALLGSRSIVKSRTRWVQLAPAAFGLGIMVLYYDANLGAQHLADTYRESGYHVSYGIGLVLLLPGSVLCLVGGVASSVVNWRLGPGPGRPYAGSARRGLGYQTELLLGALASLACAIVGGILALGLTNGSPSNGFARAGLLVILSLAGGFTGAVVTDRLWHRGQGRR